jgi:hypothetical protein
LLQRISDVCHHFTHSALILWLIFSLTPSSFCKIDLKYQNLSFMNAIYPSKLISPSFETSFLNWYFIYSVLVILSQKYFDSKVHLNNSNFWSTMILLSSIHTTSSVKSMYKKYLLVCPLWTHPSLRWKYIDSMLTLNIIIS